MRNVVALQLRQRSVFGFGVQRLCYNPNVPTTVLKGLCCKDYVLNTVFLNVELLVRSATVAQFKVAQPNIVDVLLGCAVNLCQPLSTCRLSRSASFFDHLLR
jgi:hypothetical protein